MDSNFHSSPIYNSQNTETTKVSINRQLAEEDAYIYILQKNPNEVSGQPIVCPNTHLFTEKISGRMYTRHIDRSHLWVVGL